MDERLTPVEVWSQQIKITQTSPQGLIQARWAWRAAADELGNSATVAYPFPGVPGTATPQPQPSQSAASAPLPQFVSLSLSTAVAEVREQCRDRAEASGKDQGPAGPLGGGFGRSRAADRYAA